MSRLEEIENSVSQQSEITENGIEHQVILKLDDYIYLVRQTEQADQLRKLINTHAPEGRNYTNGEVVQLFQQNHSYKQALEFYADEDNHKTDVISQWEPVIPVMKDNGEKARQALKGESK